MHTSYRAVSSLVFLAIITIFLYSCGGGANQVQVRDSADTAGPPNGDTTRTTGLLVAEADIATLPVWQQELLSDGGWTEPYIPPLAATEMPAPTGEMLLGYAEEARDRGVDIRPRIADDTRGASWLDQGGFDGESSLLKGQYDGIPRTAIPPYGCNSDGSNGYGADAFEDVIRVGTKYLPQTISFVLEGQSSPNWFNPVGGVTLSAQSAVYQLFSDMRDADPSDWQSNGRMFEEVGYRSDLAPGVGPGGDCSAAQAFLVTGLFWKRFNSANHALPGLSPVYNYDILIAPHGNQSSVITSAGQTDASFQEFYFGSIGACYGGAWLVSLQSSSSSCNIFNEGVANAYSAGDPYYCSPLYGVLLKRWQDTMVTGMAGPWEGNLGWPVFGPVAFNEGNPILTARGSYYAWGMWFERGYIWWLDYDQDTYPETPDEAQAYWYTGDNVFCPAQGEYVRMGPTVYYGGSAAWPAPAGNPRVTVVATGYRGTPASDWNPCCLTSNNEYEIPLSNDGLSTVQVNLMAQAYGGTPNVDCSYDYYVWAFRDGTLFFGDESAAKSLTHTYGSDIRNMESVYTVRVQVMDSTGAVGYGDSNPIVIAANAPGIPSGSGGSARNIAVVRNDGGTYDLSYNALVSDLDALGETYWEMAYSATIAGDVGAGGFDTVIWYRGGPADGTETCPDERVWTTAEIDSLVEILDDGVNMVLVSQNHGYNSTPYSGDGWLDNYGWDENALAQSIPTGEERLLWALGMTEAAGVELPGVDSVLRSYPVLLPSTGAVTGAFPRDGVDCDGLMAAERYVEQNGARDVPIAFSFGSPVQLVGYGRCSALQEGVVAPGFVAGVNVGDRYYGWDMAFLSGGCRHAPYQNVGAWPNYDFTDYGDASVWWVGYPWATMEVSQSALGEMVGSGQRSMVLENILNWLGTTTTEKERTEYTGHPEIIQVMVGNWETGGYNYQMSSYTWDGTAGHFPDQSMPNVYTSTDPGDNYVVTTNDNNDWINGNDIDFGFPWYAYIVDVNGDGVQIGEGNNVDDTVFFGGLLLEDPGTAWARNTALYHYGQDDLDPDNSVPSVVIDGFTPPVVVAGYYVSTTGDGGGEVRASYGTSPASITIDNADLITAECVAHWPSSVYYGGYTTGGGEYVAPSDPKLLWSMYPGHNMLVPEAYSGGVKTRVEDMDDGWDSYRWIFDVDPSVAHTVRAAEDRWNNPVFTYSNLVSEGRVVTFNYRSVPNWNPDLNRDGDNGSLGSGDVADKFPVRVRLITEFGDYVLWSETWPDHLQDPGIDPAAGGPIWEDDENDPPLFYADWPDYIEGGAYVIDVGTPVYD